MKTTEYTAIMDMVNNTSANGNMKAFLEYLYDDFYITKEDAVTINLTSTADAHKIEVIFNESNGIVFSLSINKSLNQITLLVDRFKFNHGKLDEFRDVLSRCFPNAEFVHKEME